MNKENKENKEVIYKECSLSKQYWENEMTTKDFLHLKMIGRDLATMRKKTTKELVRISKNGNKQSRKVLFERYYNYISKFASKYYRLNSSMFDISYDDMQSEALKALNISINKFDLTTNYDFSTRLAIDLKERITSNNWHSENGSLLGKEKRLIMKNDNAEKYMSEASITTPYDEDGDGYEKVLELFESKGLDLMTLNDLSKLIVVKKDFVKERGYKFSWVNYCRINKLDINVMKESYKLLTTIIKENETNLKKVMKEREDSREEKTFYKPETLSMESFSE